MVLTMLLVTGTACSYWLLLGLIGLPLTVACLPRERWWLAIPLAPLVALALISSVYNQWFFVLMQPYRLFVVNTAIVGVSIAALVIVTLLQKPTMPAASALWHAIKKAWPYLVIPFLGVVVFSMFFAVNGLEMLSGGQDEFGYVAISRHIMESLFTRDALDLPWGRADHYLAEDTGHALSYMPVMRLGANFLLADLSYLFGLSLEKAFPLLMAVAVAVGTASLGILELLVRRSRWAVIVAQIAIATSWLLVMLHIQGSLSHMASLGIRVGGLGYILWAVAFSRKAGPLILAGVLGAGWLVLYYESIGFGLALPLAASFAAILFRSIRARSPLPRRFAVRALLLTALVCLQQPVLFSEAVSRHSLLASQNTDLTGGLAAAATRAHATAANILPPILGYHSLYDDTAINHSLAIDLRPFALITLLGLAALGAVGFWRRLPAGVGVGWAVVPSALSLVAMVTASTDGFIVMVRSAQMAIPQILVGLSLLVFARRGAFDFKRASPLAKISSMGRAAAAAMLAAFVGLNAFSVARTVSYVNRHSQATDPTMRHFDPDSMVWQKLRHEVAQSNVPVLLSGFNNTPMPHMIAMGLRDIPHLAGTTITSFWTTVDPGGNIPKDPGKLREWLSRFRHWNSVDMLEARLKADPIWNWPSTYDRLLQDTRVAIVPVSGAYPAEWGRWPSLWGPRGSRFPNLCDVIERVRPAFAVDLDQPSSGEDEFGPYWNLDDTGRATSRLQATTPAVIEVRFSATAPSIFLNGRKADAKSIPGEAGNPATLTISGRFEFNTLVEVRASGSTRLRSIRFYQLPAAKNGAS
jgi:hypothetical protein